MTVKSRIKEKGYDLGRYIRRLNIENVRTFRSPATLDFCTPNGTVARWTVILGENGTGKTSLLQYIGGLIPVQDGEIALVERSRGNKHIPPPYRPMIAGSDWLGWHAGNIPRPWGRPAIVKAHIDLSQAAKSIDASTESSNKNEKGILGIKLEFGEQDSRPAITASFRIPTNLEFYEQVKIFGYGAGRHIANPNSPYLSSNSYLKEDSPVNTLFRDDTPLISPEQWLLSLDHRSRSNDESARKAKKTLASACRCLAKVLPGIKSIKVAPYGIIGESVMTVLCETHFGIVPFGSLSLGYRSMAAWLTDFLKRMHSSYGHWKNPASGPAVVLIDEFDLHMHPTWQREAMQALSTEFSNTQFIITAHSPLVIQGADENAKLAVLRRVEGHKQSGSEVIIDTDPQFAAGWRVDQILASDLYGLSPRSEKYTDLILERVKLRQKETLTDAEKARLAQIEVFLDKNAPPGLSGSSQQLLKEIRDIFQS